MRIGILTYHRACNYGAFLQAYGLCKRLNEEPDISAEIIDFRMEKEEAVYSVDQSLKYLIRHYKEYKFLSERNEIFRNAVQELPVSLESLTSNNIEDFQRFVQNKYDVIIVGSDEVWKIDGFRGFPNPYWLPGNLGCKKAAYAVSSRSDLSSMDEMNCQMLRKYLTSFSVISVRDEKTFVEIGKVYENRDQLLKMPDPSFVYSYDVSSERGKDLLINKYGLNSKMKIALVMTEEPKLANRIKSECPREYQLISVFHLHKGIKSIADLTPFEWLDVIAAVDFVFASYFHAVCFSYVNRIPFLAFTTSIKKSKLQEITYQTGTESRLVDFETNGTSIEALMTAVQSEEFDMKFLDESRVRFVEYLTHLREIELQLKGK